MHLVAGSGYKQPDGKQDIQLAIGPNIHVAMANPGRENSDEVALIGPALFVADGSSAHLFHLTKEKK